MDQFFFDRLRRVPSCMSRRVFRPSLLRKTPVTPSIFSRVPIVQSFLIFLPMSLSSLYSHCAHGICAHRIPIYRLMHALSCQSAHKPTQSCYLLRIVKHTSQVPPIQNPIRLPPFQPVPSIPNSKPGFAEENFSQPTHKLPYTRVSHCSAYAVLRPKESGTMTPGPAIRISLPILTLAAL